MYAFIDAHRTEYGVEPLCRRWQIAPSGYYAYRAGAADPTRRSARAQRDEALRAAIRQVWVANRCVYGARKVWRQLHRDGMVVARCTVECLMATDGLHGVRRGRRIRTTVPAAAESPAERPQDLVQRQLTATQPNQLWVADFTYVATWRGFVSVAFVVDVFSRRIVGWRAHTTMRSDLGLDALEQALHERQTDAGLVHHSDRGGQYLSMRYTARLAEAGIAPSVGSRGDSYDNALAESLIGLDKAEGIHRAGPWRGFEDVESATLEWVAWFNTQRLLESLGYLPPAEYEEQYHRRHATYTALAALN